MLGLLCMIVAPLFIRNHYYKMGESLITLGCCLTTLGVIITVVYLLPL